MDGVKQGGLSETAWALVLLVAGAACAGLLLAQERSLAPLHLPTLSDPRAKRVALAFESDPADRRPRAAWARFAGASERTLERLFHAEAGMSFGRWQRQVRLMRALEGLAEGRSVTEVGLAVGFDTPSAFIAMFRSAMGTTPGRYFAAPAASA